MSVVDQSIAHYNLLEHLGAGGLGDVYRARDTKVGRTVALKLLPAETPGTPARGEAFAAAIREASTLSHPNIATLFDAGEYAARSYLARPLVPGPTSRCLPKHWTRKAVGKSGAGVSCCRIAPTGRSRRRSRLS